MLSQVLNRTDKPVLLVWTFLAGFVLVISTFIFMNDTYSSYWGINQLAELGVMVGADPSTTIGKVANMILATGLGVVNIFLAVLVGITTVQIALSKDENEKERLRKTRNIQVGFFIACSIVDFLADISYRFEKGNGFSELFVTLVPESVALGVLVFGLVILVTKFQDKLDFPTRVAISISFGYVAFVGASYYLGFDIWIYIVFALSTIGTLAVYTFGNEILFSMAISFLFVAVPILDEHYSFSSSRRKNNKEELEQKPKREKDGIVSHMGEAIAGVHMSDSPIRESTQNRGRPNNR